MWGTATVRGESDVIVRRLNFDEQYCWKTEQEIEGHRLHTDEDVEDFVPHNWSWLERRSMRNPDGEAFWEWYSSYNDPHYWVSLSLLWDSWGLGPNYERQYGSDWSEDRWFVSFSFGPLHFSVNRIWNTPKQPYLERRG
jgi:hypothetical protein